MSSETERELTPEEAELPVEETGPIPLAGTDELSDDQLASISGGLAAGADAPMAFGEKDPGADGALGAP